MIEFQNVSRFYGDRLAVDDFSQTSLPLGFCKQKKYGWRRDFANFRPLSAPTFVSYATTTYTSPDFL